ncbi:hypothetical protein HF325_006894 [Metschnikowia pulcherrima]|uniref:Uncharacterized protein n=1 Tax=Metschnikowia pulcherrima TaxID=27326 RepID=A0A8H7L8W8_9ASCO|nr:hypothetical protein HF325_006894 [Metschnikowia pulcherrima]
MASLKKGQMLVVVAGAKNLSNHLTDQGFYVFGHSFEFAKASKTLWLPISMTRSMKKTCTRFVYPLEKLFQTWHILFTDDRPRGRLITNFVQAA